MVMYFDPITNQNEPDVGDIRYVISHLTIHMDESDYKECENDIRKMAAGFGDEYELVKVFDFLQDAEKELSNYRCSVNKNNDTYEASAYFIEREEYCCPMKDYIWYGTTTWDNTIFAEMES